MVQGHLIFFGAYECLFLASLSSLV
jgi:hypothetical protein